MRWRALVSLVWNFELFRLIDWLLVLPAQTELQFRKKLEEIEREKHMPYITSVERLAKEEGREEGRKQALRESILDALEARFAAVPEPVRRRISEENRVETLRALLKRAVSCCASEDLLHP